MQPLISTQQRSNAVRAGKCEGSGGPSKAKAIIAYRDKNAYKSVDDLGSVKGFEKASIDKLRPELNVGKPDVAKSVLSAKKP